LRFSSFPPPLTFQLCVHRAENWKFHFEIRHKNFSQIHTKKAERLVNRILLRNAKVTPLPFDFLMSLFRDQFIQVSASLGIIVDVSALSVARDGTSVRTAAFPRSKRICDCRKRGINQCTCNRLYSQPDCDIGWDSHRNCHYFGYHLYMFTASDSRYDLPLYPRLGRASRHDSVSLISLTSTNVKPETRSTRTTLRFPLKVYPSAQKD